MFEVKKSNIKFTNRIGKCTVGCDAHQYITINNERHNIYRFEMASCDDGDIFSEEFGKELAGVKAEIGILIQYKKLLISLTKQPEWRKEKVSQHMQNGEIKFMTWEDHKRYHLGYGIK